MDAKTAILRLVNGLNHQEFNFSEKLFTDAFNEEYEYLTGTKKKVYQALNDWFSDKGLVSYSHIDKEQFQSDLECFQRNVDERMLLSWGYKMGSLAIVGIMYADHIGHDELKAIFSRFDDGLVNTMRKHVGNVSQDTAAGVFGTMILIFADPEKARSFNNRIKDFYSSHFWKKTYSSVLTVDCVSETLTQGKHLMGRKWDGSIEIAALKKSLFENNFYVG